VQNPVSFPQRLDGPRWNGWGRILATVGFSSSDGRIEQDQVPLLHLKWAFGFLGRSAAVAQPTIVGGLVFVGGGDREVTRLTQNRMHALDVQTEAIVRTAISFAPISGTDSLPCSSAICLPMPTP